LYEVLKPSVAGPLNESLQDAINSGALQLIRDEDESLSCRMKNHKDKDPWFRGSLDSYNGAMEWHW
jgi:hypothetical protein